MTLLPADYQGAGGGQAARVILDAHLNHPSIPGGVEYRMAEDVQPGDLDLLSWFELLPNGIEHHEGAILPSGDRDLVPGIHEADDCAHGPTLPAPRWYRVRFGNGETVRVQAQVASAAMFRAAARLQDAGRGLRISRRIVVVELEGQP